MLSLISLYNIDAIVVKKTERNSFNGRPKKSGFFKLYLEGVMLSLAGSQGIKNRHLEKASIIALLDEQNVYDKTLEEIEDIYNIELNTKPSLLDTAVLKNRFIICSNTQ